MQGGGGSLPELQQTISAGEFQFYAILIYSDVDTNFINFLNLSHDALSIMSGKKVFVFWFENFERDSILLWKPGNEPSDRKLSVKRNDSLRLAKALEIPLSNTPCLLVCRSLEDKEAVVYSFDNTWSHEHLAEHFKAVFDTLEDFLNRFQKPQTFYTYESLDNRFMNIRIKKWVKRVISNQSIGNMLRAIATGVTVAG